MFKTNISRSVSAAALLTMVATGCVLTPFPNSTLANPFVNIDFSGFVTAPSQTIRVQYQTPNGIWNNVGTTVSDAFMTDGVYEWSLTDNVPAAGWGPHGDDYQTKIRVQNLSSGELLPMRNGDNVMTLYAAGPEG